LRNCLFKTSHYPPKWLLTLGYFGLPPNSDPLFSCCFPPLSTLIAFTSLASAVVTRSSSRGALVEIASEKACFPYKEQI
jgi:hypothetical protein